MITSLFPLFHTGRNLTHRFTLYTLISGRCRRFRLVSFRDNDVWVDDNEPGKVISPDQKSVPVLLSEDIPNHERQAALADQKLGERVFDGMEAVAVGLAKRGVVQTYSMIEGCPKELGCTVILRVRVVCFIECSSSLPSMLTSASCIYRVHLDQR